MHYSDIVIQWDSRKLGSSARINTHVSQNDVIIFPFIPASTEGSVKQNVKLLPGEYLQMYISYVIATDFIQMSIFKIYILILLIFLFQYCRAYKVAEFKK